MRIAVWHNLPSGGGKRALYYHVQGLVERGHTVEAWCPPTADQSYLPLGTLIPEHVLPLEFPVVSPKNKLGQAWSLYQQVADRIQAMDNHCQLCADQINMGHFDVLFANTCTFFRTTSIGRWVKIPKLIYLQEPYRWLYEAMPQLPWLALMPPKSGWSPRYGWRFITNLLQVQGFRVQAREEIDNARAFDAILVNSLFSRETILRSYGLDSQVCYLGVDTNLFHDQERERENWVIGIGAFVPEKNIKFVIQSLARLGEPRPALIWVGNAAKTHHLEELERFAALAQVDFQPKHRIGDQELVDLLNRATLMVYAPRLEPFGYAPLEANSCGCPVVAVAEGGVRETILDGVNGLLLEHDPQIFADTIQKLLTDKEYARRLGKQGRRLVVEKWALALATDRIEKELTKIS